MANYFEPILSEEQMAAYLDGMLSIEESNMVEELISSVPEMEEIRDTIDFIDSTYINESENEVPIECMADDFILPEVNAEYSQFGNAYEGYTSDESDDDPDGDQDNFCASEYMDEPLETEGDDTFLDNEYTSF